MGPEQPAGADGAALLAVRGVHKTFARSGRGHRSVALAGVDLEVAPGSFAAILGPSGSGKTTLLRCIAGFERPDTGTITLDGRVLDGPGARHEPPYSRRVGIVPQESALFPHLSVAQNIAFGLKGRSRHARRARVDELLELIDMTGYGNRRPHQLSGGQQQRVALARALAPEPQLVLLDEPFSALDAQLRDELREEVRRLLARVGATAVLVTHDQDEALTLADHLVVLRSGHVVAAGDPHDLYDHPPDVETARFLGSAAILRGRVRRSDDRLVAECALGSVPLRGWGETGPGTCCVMARPEHLAIAHAAAGAGHGNVERVAYRGSDTLVTVRLHEGPTVTAMTPGEVRYAPGDEVDVSVLCPLSAYPSTPPSVGDDPGDRVRTLRRRT